MKKVYIAAPFRANKNGTQEENIERAIEIGRKVKHRVFPVIPHIALAYIDEETERELAMQHCKALLESCDEVWICSTTFTEGMVEEITHALDMGMVVCNMGGMV